MVWEWYGSGMGVVRELPPSGCLDLSLRFLEVNWIYYCTFFMDGIKIIPRNENCKILGGSSLL